ncbi:NADP-specific glutamate dehydrogenase [Salipiger mucosus]|uniref:Glutamate dehydrogenase n=1 Tax=Salipiger mucosus DSM 16094 TaxID=1123237 RepID=S9S9A2_9RHOB|nr:NADP-specific glutamate dehydrogenase [Salipiger mucosus]EPX86740.1 NADP-specific glutamate dehydrogenase [Salipiger mucosus DSM 16094]
MTDRRDSLLETFMQRLCARSPGETEFHQAAEEIARDVITVEKAHSGFAAARVLDRLSEPDRVIAFRVVWEDDAGQTRINRGWRVQTSNAIGPYKGGLRFHPDLSLSVLKFLGFEQCFKNALTGLPLGGAKGGADFDPRGRSGGEIMRFCHAFMGELCKYIGPDRDIPAGDINVSPREIGWMFGAYKRHCGEFHGALTGKGESFGGSALRVEATGYGLIYFVCAMLRHQDSDLEGRRVAISGAGNVATHAAELAIREGARVVSLSDSSGALLAEDGLTQDTVDRVRRTKAAGGNLSELSGQRGLRYLEGGAPWGQVEAEVLLPCATQNEVDETELRAALDAGAGMIAEGANMPLTAGAVSLSSRKGLIHAPGKAANAGGVAISGLEMSQNAHGQFLDAAQVDDALRGIMRRIHDTVAEEGRTSDGRLDYRLGANVAGYRKLANAISAFGAI